MSSKPRVLVIGCGGIGGLATALLTEHGHLMDADLLARAEDGERPAMTELAQRCQADLAAVSDLIARAFFAHADTPEALVSQGRMHPVDGAPV